jgi:peptidoglycan hydrolase-like protein with peptidoglycan-binding domain
VRAELVRQCVKASPGSLRRFRVCLLNVFGSTEPWAGEKPDEGVAAAVPEEEPPPPPRAPEPSGAGSDDPFEAAPPPQNSPATVARVQRVLSRLGYEPGPPDGRLGSTTRTAVASFEADHGLPPDGVIDGEFLARLSAVAVATPAPGEAEGAGEGASDRRRHAAVRAAGPPPGRELDARGVFRAASPAVYVVRTFSSVDAIEAGEFSAQGSAVAVGASEALTNCHVLGSEPIIILTQGSRDFWLAERAPGGDPRTDRCSGPSPASDASPTWRSASASTRSGRPAGSRGPSRKASSRA